MALGDHLRADQDVDLAGVHRAELGLERALPARAVGVDPGDPRPGQQRRDLLLEPLGAAADRRDVGIAAIRAASRHRVGEAAVVAAQGPVLLVEDAPGAAVRAAALPAALAAVQHRGVAAPVEEDQALLAAGDPRLDRRDQRRGERGGRAPAPGELAEVEQAHLGPGGAADPLGQRRAAGSGRRRH